MSTISAARPQNGDGRCADSHVPAPIRIAAPAASGASVITIGFACPAATASSTSPPYPGTCSHSRCARPWNTRERSSSAQPSTPHITRGSQPCPSASATSAAPPTRPMPDTMPVTTRSAAAVRSSTSLPCTVSVSRRSSAASTGTGGSISRPTRNATAGISVVSPSASAAISAAAPVSPTLPNA